MNKSALIFSLSLIAFLQACSNNSEATEQSTVKVATENADEQTIQKYRERLGKSITFNEEEALVQAKQKNKRLLLYFTAFGSSTGRAQETKILLHPSVIAKIESNYLFKVIYVDDKILLPKGQQGSTQILGRMKNIQTIGDVNFVYQMLKFELAIHPYFAIISTTGEVIATADYSSLNLTDFQQFLEAGTIDSE